MGTQLTPVYKGIWPGLFIDTGRTHVGERFSLMWPSPIMFLDCRASHVTCLEMAKTSLMCYSLRDLRAVISSSGEPESSQ